MGKKKFIITGVFTPKFNLQLSSSDWSAVLGLISEQLYIPCNVVMMLNRWNLLEAQLVRDESPNLIQAAAMHVMQSNLTKVYKKAFDNMEFPEGISYSDLNISYAPHIYQARYRVDFEIDPDLLPQEFKADLHSRLYIKHPVKEGTPLFWLAIRHFIMRRINIDLACFRAEVGPDFYKIQETLARFIKHSFSEITDDPVTLLRTFLIIMLEGTKDSVIEELDSCITKLKDYDIKKEGE
jgi:hypothetical protein